LEQLLTTKLFIPPLRSGIIPRPHLYNRLNESLNQKLSLVSAPAGFGKSTLVSGWLAENDLEAAWLSLDRGDNDPARFWTYLIAAIQTLHQETGQEARQIISAPQLRSTDPVVISLINDISHLPKDLIVVLDDYHVIENGGVHDSLGYLLEHQPPNLHLVLLTRVDPPFSMARLRAHSSLVEIRARDLQFSSQEAERLFNDVLHLNLRPEQVQVLNEHAEGWIVSLNLAALSLKGEVSSDAVIRRFTGSHQYILDYLTEEVLESLPDAQRQFLLRTSILDRFCPALCTEVTGNPTSPQVLAELRSENLFLIPLDAGGTWFRYHHLFSEVLYALLERDYPEEIHPLHLKASLWFDREGFPGEAVDHALLSGDMSHAREQVLKHGTPFLHRGEVATVQRWLDGLPEKSDEPDPYVPLARCWALFLSWQNSAIESRLTEANIAYEQLLEKGALSSAQQNEVAAQLAMMRSVLARDRGEHTMSVAYAEEAALLMPQEVMGGTGTAWNMLAAARAGAGDFEGAIEAYAHGITLAYIEGNLIGAYGCTYGQAMYMLVQGRLREAEGLCRQSINRATHEGHGDYPAAGWLHIAMARIELERNRLDEAEVFLSDGLRIARPGGFNEAVRTGRYLRAQLAGARGDMGFAKDILQDTEMIINAMDEPYLTGELTREWVSLYIKSGELGAASEKLQVLEKVSASTKHANLLLWKRWLSPRLLCAEQRFEEARKVLEVSISHARSINSHGELVRLLGLQTVVLDQLGYQTHAREALIEALAIAADSGYIWRFLEVGQGLVKILQDLIENGKSTVKHQRFIHSVLDALRDVYPETPRSQPTDLPEPLTPRELEILELICKGYSNPEIASELVVSLNTVKKHTSHIYGKLGVGSRTQAIARAQQLNLI
jgi:LuxR family maltose regulon positive regulatory protein